MAVIEINRNPSRRELNWFGLLFLLFFGMIGGVVRWKTGSPVLANFLWVGAAAFCAIYYSVPPLRLPLYLGWLYLAFPIGWTVSHVLLGAIYYLVFTPIGLIMRAFGRDPMGKKPDRNAATYWSEHDPARRQERYFRQF